MKIYGPPTCTFTQFLVHLASERSGAVNEAQLIWDQLVRNNIDPAVALGFFHHESSCGKMGRAVATLSWGNIRYLPKYANLPYPVGNIDGFCSYQNYLLGAKHFCDHLLGLDGTDNYRGLTTVEEVVPIWAPPGDNNTPFYYILAVNTFVEKLTGRKGTMIKVLSVAGHLRTQQMTPEGLCDGLDKVASALKLRGSTGTRGEVEYTGDMATRVAVKLNATGHFDARAVDCIFHKELYIDWKPDMVIAHHYHRDAVGRAMFSVPDNVHGFHSPAANQESMRMIARLIGEYERRTGIPVTQDNQSLGMRQLYTWCYIHNDSQAYIAEYGHADKDAPALYNGIETIANYTVHCLLQHFNLPTVTPTPPAPTPPPPVVTPPIDKLAQAKVLAQKILDL